MRTSAQRVTFGLATASAVTVAAVFVFIWVGLVPYWQELSGAEVQDWFAGPFTRFSTMMVPVHFASIILVVLTLILMRQSAPRWLLLIALAGLLICQGFNFTLYVAVLNPSLQSQTLSDEAALTTLDRWSFFHVIRTGAILVCVLALLSVPLFPRRSAPA
jgi:hypothetical protein